MGAAETMLPTANTGSVAPELGGTAVILDEIAFGIAGVDADGQPFEQPVPWLQGLLQGAEDD
jgi:hypothetical protein